MFDKWRKRKPDFNECIRVRNKVILLVFLRKGSKDSIKTSKSSFLAAIMNFRIWDSNVDIGPTRKEEFQKNEKSLVFLLSNKIFIYDLILRKPLIPLQF